MCIRDSTKTVTLRPDEVDEVAAALARYDTARNDLDEAATAGLSKLRARRARRSRS